MLHLVAALAVVVLTASASLAQPICPGDCNRDNRVTVAELVRAVGMSLGTAATPCGFADVDGNGSVSIAELVQAVKRGPVGLFCDAAYADADAFGLAYTDGDADGDADLAAGEPDADTAASDAVPRAAGMSVQLL